jgi:hypothetical protein
MMMFAFIGNCKDTNCLCANCFEQRSNYKTKQIDDVKST